MPFTIIDVNGNIKTSRMALAGGALLSAQNTFSNTSGQIIQGPLDLTAATAGQIKFPASQNASADVNTLDDYEEGTWSPLITGAGGATGQTYGIQTGRYIKIGKLVIASFYAQLSAAGVITGVVGIGGLPFPSQNVTSGQVAGVLTYFEALATNWIFIGFQSRVNGTFADIYGRSTAGTTVVAFGSGDIGNTSAFIGTITYPTTA